MASEMSSESDKNQLIIEWHGQLSVDELHRLTDQIGDAGTITKFRVEVETEHPAEITSLLTHSETDQPTETTTTNTEADTEPPEIESEAPASTASNQDAESPESEPSEPAETESIPRLQPGGTPFRVMRILRTHDTWLRTTQIREASPADWEVNEDNLGVTLWNLADRDLIDKRPYEDDKRQTEYRITSLGEQAVDAALEQVENQDGTELEPLPDEQLSIPESE